MQAAVAERQAARGAAGLTVPAARRAEDEQNKRLKSLVQQQKGAEQRSARKAGRLLEEVRRHSAPLCPLCNCPSQ